MAQTTKQLTKAEAARTTLPATPEEVEVITDLSILSKTPSLRIVSDHMKAKNSEKLAGLVGVALVESRNYSHAVSEAAKELRAFRLMFPASKDTQKVLGENAPDLVGKTNEYRTAWGKVLEAGRAVAAERFVGMGMTQDAAEKQAVQEAETFRQSVSRRYRINIEAEAKKLGPLGARYLLAHGFERNGECGKNQILTKDATLILPEVPEGTPISLADTIVQLPTVAPKTTPPAEPSDQVKPGETADAIEGDRMGDEVLDPMSLINEAVGMLNRAADLLPEAKVSLRERNAARQALVSAIQNVTNVLGGAPAKVAATK